MTRKLLFISILVGLLYVNPSLAQGYFRVVDPVVDNMVTPLGLDELPVFGWSIESNVVGAGQSAYQIVICDKAGTKVWDTGKVASSKTANVELDYKYASRLKKATDYFWTVTVWDTKGKVLHETDLGFGVRAFGALEMTNAVSACLIHPV